MAIKLDITEERFGSLITDAYIKFCYLRWSIVDLKVMAVFSVWATPTAEAEGKECVETFEIDVSTIYPNIQANMYKEVKKLDKYANAVDV